jgi:hypothetical protein
MRLFALFLVVVGMNLVTTDAEACHRLRAARAARCSGGYVQVVQQSCTPSYSYNGYSQGSYYSQPSAPAVAPSYPSTRSNGLDTAPRPQNPTLNRQPALDPAPRPARNPRLNPQPRDW